MSVIDLKFLKEAGMHYGHLSHKRHPKAEPYILGKQGNIHIINLKETLQSLKTAYDFVYALSKEGKKILYVCTKPYTRKIIEREAKRSKNHYVNFRWLGGTLTNAVTIRQSIKKLEEIDRLAKDSYTNMLKKEISKKEKERKKLDAILGGIRYMFREPAAVFIIDIRREKIALNEVKKKKIPVIALVDTNVNPELVDYPVPGNDDSPKTIDLFCQIISAAAIEGKAVFEKFREEQKQEAIKLKEQSFKKQAFKKDSTKKIITNTDNKTATKTIGKVDEKKMDVKADNKTATKTIGKVDEKKMDVKADNKTATKTIGKVEEKKMDVKADNKTATKTIGKVDEKKMDVKADNKTATKTIDKVDEKKMDVKADTKTATKTIGKVDEKKMDVKADRKETITKKAN